MQRNDMSWSHRQHLLSSKQQHELKRYSGRPVSTSEKSGIIQMDTDSDTDAEQDQAMQFDKLGMLVAVVDSAASDFVFGPSGSAGRPDGVLDIDLLASADRSGMLSAEGHAKWMQFLGVWALAGWSMEVLLQVTHELRPLQYGSNLEEHDLADVSSEQLDACIMEYCNLHEAPADQLKDFLLTIQRNFSQSDAVLVPAKDALSRLAEVLIV